MLLWPARQGIKYNLGLEKVGGYEIIRSEKEVKGLIKMAYRLICIDMDGTLLNEKGEVPLENQKALQEAHKKGVTIALSTGRNYRCASIFSDMIGVSGPVIAANGAQIGTREQKEPIFISVMSKESLTQFYRIAEKYPMTTYFMTDWGIISNIDLAEDHPYKVLNRSLPEDAKLRLEVVEDFYEAFERFDGEILKAICIEGKEKGKLTNLRKELEALDCYELVASWHDNVEIMNKGVSKGEGVRRLAEHLGIQQHEIMCMGDSENDLSMIKYAGLGVAMGNASDEIKAAADYVTDTNIQAGVAKAVRQWVL